MPIPSKPMTARSIALFVGAALAEIGRALPARWSA
jgi:hypothetical protein